MIHLGATSQDIVCNADLLIMREGLELITAKTAMVIDRLGTFSAGRAGSRPLDSPTQPAQPTTVGRRATTWPRTS